MILIPAYEPKAVLFDVVVQLKRLVAKLPFDCKIVIVNDGSQSEEAKDIFSMIKNQGVKVLKHAVNQGKGAALKTGVQYALLHNHEWIVTADADGQHLPIDIINILIKGRQFGDDVVLGVRTFDKSTPLRSRFGNCLTKHFFKLFYGGNISDTQTGLRYIPGTYFEMLLAIPFNHYEFEFASLIKTIQNGTIRQVAIQTVYEPGNPTSHFNKFIDSARIYWVLARSIVVSASTTVVDISLFMLLQQFNASTLLCILVSRTVATLLYFSLARSFVFKSRSKALKQFVLYSILVLINALILSPVIDYIYSTTGLFKGITYVCLTIPLYLVNLSIQRWVIFRD